MSFADRRALLRAALFVLSLLPVSCFASVSTLRVANGRESNLVASGDIYTSIGGDQLGTWNLQASVSGTDFSNEHIAGGSQGVQYTMLNPVFGSTHTNEMVFSVEPVDSAVPQITLRQSPYFQDPEQWNGGNKEADVAQFTIRWDGEGSAVVRDPEGQFEPLLQQASSDSTVPSGTTFTFSDFQIFNSDDAWEIELPPGVDSVEMDWSSSQPTAGSDLTREWIAFDTNFVVVPEPNASLLIVLMSCLCGFVCRRHILRRKQ